MAARVYFLSLPLLSGFLYPLESSSSAVQVLSQLSPLTHLKPLLEAGRLAPLVEAIVQKTSAPLILQAIVYSAIGWWLFIWLRKSI
jgi:hypothetical protein